ncbi:hypothetical protein CK203_040098 [Vitis vinifera]|uniref:Uncharacterized protein n=1 Tax=Vitis vinifera TaxID=29760 RepID=A0A438IDZ5_VITVI|nr:hypothetical protein CK203_040098 [Vitis vinifera]
MKRGRSRVHDIPGDEREGSSSEKMHCGMSIPLKVDGFKGPSNCGKKSALTFSLATTHVKGLNLQIKLASRYELFSVDAIRVVSSNSQETQASLDHMVSSHSYKRKHNEVPSNGGKGKEKELNLTPIDEDEDLHEMGIHDSGHFPTIDTLDEDDNDLGEEDLRQTDIGGVIQDHKCNVPEPSPSELGRFGYCDKAPSISGCLGFPLFGNLGLPPRWQTRGKKRNRFVGCVCWEHHPPLEPLGSEQQQG